MNVVLISVRKCFSLKIKKECNNLYQKCISHLFVKLDYFLLWKYQCIKLEILILHNIGNILLKLANCFFCQCRIHILLIVNQIHIFYKLSYLFQLYYSIYYYFFYSLTFCYRHQFPNFFSFFGAHNHCINLSFNIIRSLHNSFLHFSNFIFFFQEIVLKVIFLKLRSFQ